MSLNASEVGHLKQYVQKLENLETEKKEIQEQISDVFKQIQNDGFDVKILRKVLRLRKMKTQDRTFEEELLHLYMHALGMANDSEERDTSQI
ncbi:MAG: DUF2312 domain-containing protein [Holosporales bacterium]|jgi:uncharacterized protein (UPF0335 family)|nr:DUF2312 domain-containing protein [Holosporales bacterium]